MVEWHLLTLWSDSQGLFALILCIRQDLQHQLVQISRSFCKLKKRTFSRKQTTTQRVVPTHIPLQARASCRKRSFLLQSCRATTLWESAKKEWRSRSNLHHRVLKLILQQIRVKKWSTCHLWRINCKMDTSSYIIRTVPWCRGAIKCNSKTWYLKGR